MPKPGPKPKPAKLKALEGNPGKRTLPKEPTLPAKIPDPPEGLAGYALEEWNRVAPGLCSMGILAEIDRGLLSSYCTAWATYLDAQDELGKLREKGGAINAMVMQTKSGNWIQQPLIGIRNKAAADLVRFGDLLGMGASGRARLGIDMSKIKKSKFSGLIGMDGGKKQ